MLGRKTLKIYLTPRHSGDSLEGSSGGDNPRYSSARGEALQPLVNNRKKSGSTKRVLLRGNLGEKQGWREVLLCLSEKQNSETIIHLPRKSLAGKAKSLGAIKSLQENRGIPSHNPRIKRVSAGDERDLRKDQRYRTISENDLAKKRSLSLVQAGLSLREAAKIRAITSSEG